MLMMAKKGDISSLLRSTVFWKKVSEIYVHDISNKILLCDSNHIAGLVMWSKFANSSIFLKEVIVTFTL